MFAFNWSWMHSSKRHLGPMATHKDLLALVSEEGEHPISRSAEAELKV